MHQRGPAGPDHALSRFAQELAGSAVDEVKSGTGLTDHRFIGALRIVRGDLLGQPVLHIQPCARTSKNDVTHGAELFASFLDDHVDLDQRARKYRRAFGRG